MTTALATPGETTAARLMAYPGLRRVPSPRIELFDRPGFLPAELCARLIELIDKDRRPSTIADPNGDHYFRTSETCDLDGEEPAVRDLEARLFALNGIDPAHGEPVQGQRYEAGQEFKAHTDYFEPNGQDFTKYCSVAGQRTWTFMIYLNEVDAGGATRFKVVDKMFRPETGKLVGWNNHRPDGTLNAATLHHGMKVRKGVKYVITKWYRERLWGMVREGACHCGAVRFTADVEEPLRGARCDCSICAVKGAVTVGTPLDGLKILEGEDLLSLYRFNTGVAKHYFCSKCGTYTFHQRRSDPNTYGVNVACLGLNPYHDFPDVAVVDGIHHARDTGKARLAGRLRFEENGD